MSQNQSAREEMGGGDVIALVDPSKWDHPGAPQLAYANGWNEALRLSSGDQVHSAFGSIPTALPDGLLDELERLAKEATPGPWAYRDMRPSTYGPAFVDSADVQSLAICGEAVGRSDTHGFCLQVDSEERMSNAAYIAAANPAVVLKLIEAVRASQVGMERSGMNQSSDHPQQQGEKP